MSALLNELLDQNQVILDLRAETQGEAIAEIVESLRANGHVQDATKLADAVMEREGRSSTNTGEGVAFPHARTDLLDEIVLGIGCSRAGIQFGSVPKPVHLIFLIGVPQRMVNEYLICVGAIARIVKDDARRSALMKVGTASEFVELMRIGSLEL
jgi:PTS system fructose-specific IIC component